MKLAKLIEDLGWDYDRMSSSGQQTYDEIVEILDRMKHRASGERAGS